MVQKERYLKLGNFNNTNISYPLLNKEEESRKIISDTEVWPDTWYAAAHGSWEKAVRRDNPRKFS